MAEYADGSKNSAERRPFPDRIADSQHRPNGIAGIAVAQVSVEACRSKPRFERSEVMNREGDDGVRVHARAHDAVNRGGHGADDDVLHAHLAQLIDDVEKKQGRLAGSLGPHWPDRVDFARARRPAS
jgi:hypothetical protein